MSYLTLSDVHKIKIKIENNKSKAIEAFDAISKLKFTQDYILDLLDWLLLQIPKEDRKCRIPILANRILETLT